MGFGQLAADPYRLLDRGQCFGLPADGSQHYRVAVQRGRKVGPEAVQARFGQVTADSDGFFDRLDGFDKAAAGG